MSGVGELQGKISALSIALNNILTQHTDEQDYRQQVVQKCGPVLTSVDVFSQDDEISSNLRALLSRVRQTVHDTEVSLLRHQEEDQVYYRDFRVVRADMRQCERLLGEVQDDLRREMQDLDAHGVGSDIGRKAGDRVVEAAKVVERGANRVTVNSVDRVR